MPDRGQNAPDSDRTPGRFTRRDVLIMVALFVLAFAIRCIYVLQLRASPYFDHETMDAGYHDAWAKAIASGQTFVEGPYFRAPLYAWLLAGLYKLTGTKPAWVRSVACWFTSSAGIASAGWCAPRRQSCAARAG